MDLNYTCSDMCINEFIESRRRDAGAFQEGTGSPMVVIIGRSATALSRAANRIARWADGSSELHPGARPSALIR